MGKKKAAPKSKQGSVKPKKAKRNVKPKAKEETVEIQMSQAVWDSVVAPLPPGEARTRKLRYIFAMAIGQETVEGVKYCKLKVKKSAAAMSDDAKDDDSGEGKLCEEGP